MLASTPSLISFSIYLFIIVPSYIFFSVSAPPENTVFVISSVRSLIGEFKLGARRKTKTHAPPLMQRSAESRRSARTVFALFLLARSLFFSLTRCRGTFCAHFRHLQIDAQQQSAAASHFNKLFIVLRRSGLFVSCILQIRFCTKCDWGERGK